MSQAGAKYAEEEKEYRPFYNSAELTFGRALAGIRHSVAFETNFG